MDMKTPTHVIFGTGPLAQAVMKELLRQGIPVRMVNRSGKAPVPDAVEIVAGDAYDPQVTRQLCQGAAVVYQCAQPPYTQWPEKFPALQASILSGAAANGSVLVVAENLYMYGPVSGSLQENLPYAATTRKGRTRARMSEALLAAHRQGKVQVVMGRGSDFYGPGVLASALGERIFPRVLAGKPVTAIGSVDLPHTYTYIDDFGKALVLLGQQEFAYGRAWHVPNAPTRSTRAVIELAFKVAGIHPIPPIQGMGSWMMRLGGLFIPEARETVEMMYEFTDPFVVDDSAFRQSFGMEATPLEEGIQRTLAWYQTRG